jgi:drug/metabolite transporter (DMT)-like permease
MTGRRPLGHWLLLIALATMWGSSFLFTKIAVASLAPTTVVAARLVIAALVLGALVLILGKRLPRERRAWLFIVAMAVAGNVLPFWLITWGQQGIDSGLAGILMAIMPLTTLVLAHFLVAGERLNPMRMAGFLLGFLGIVVLMGPDALLELEGRGTVLLSELAVLGGAVCYAVATIIARRRPPGDALATAAGVMLCGSALTVPAALVTPLSTAEPLALASLAAVAVLGLVSTALATVVYLRLVSQAGAGFVSLINYLIPLWALVLGMAVLGEQPQWSALAALIMILSGIALSEILGRRTSR